MAGGIAQASGQKAEKWGWQRSGDSRETKLIFTSMVAKPRLSCSPDHPSQRNSPHISSETEHHRVPGEPEQMLPKLSLTLTGTETEGSECD